MITQRKVKEYFNYCPDTGVLTWKVNKAKCVKIGDEIGSKNNKGYYQVGIDGKRYKVARIIFLYCYGYLPEVVDHINGEITDNRIDNLRGCTNNENICNRKPSKNSTSSYLGVSFFKPSNRWKAQIKKYGKVTYLGLYDSEKDAAIAYNKAAAELHGHFANINLF